MVKNARIDALNGSTFDLDFSGVAGFFGGDVAVEAMSTVHLYRWRSLLGWYNMPGSWEMAKNYGRLCRSRFWHSVYPGKHPDSTEFFDLAGRDGPSYRAVHSGTYIPKTGHAAHLVLRLCKKLPASITVQGRLTKAVSVTIAELSNIPPPVIRIQPLSTFSTFCAGVPILATGAAAVACAVFDDWFCFSMILAGAAASGLSSLALGLSALTFEHHVPAPGAPLGDGMLQSGDEIVIVLGEEGAVSAITRGTFHLNLSGGDGHHWIGITSLLLMAQFLVQLLLVPQGTLFGQIMFLGTLFVSWIYNSALCSLDREGAQIQILQGQILRNLSTRKFTLQNRTSMAVFVLLVVAGRKQTTEESLKEILDDILSNDTPVWRHWRHAVLPRIVDASRSIELRNWRSLYETSQAEADVHMQGTDLQLLRTLLEDAADAYTGYLTNGLEGRPPTLPAPESNGHGSELDPTNLATFNGDTGPQNGYPRGDSIELIEHQV